MTQETAEKIRILLERRDRLQYELDEISTCDDMRGHINIGPNGIGFLWVRSDNHIMWLIHGLEEEINKINTLIESM